MTLELVLRACHDCRSMHRNQIQLLGCERGSWRTALAILQQARAMQMQLNVAGAPRCSAALGGDLRCGDGGL